MNSQTRCPRCDGARLKGWDELNEEEREVVKRLPASADSSLEERRQNRLWCPNCWHEEPPHEERG